MSTGYLGSDKLDYDKGYPRASEPDDIEPKYLDLITIGSTSTS